MKQKVTLFILLFSTTISLNSLFAQKYTLTLSSKTAAELSVLHKIDYQKKHKDSLSIYNELDRVSSYLKKIGYFSNTINSVSKDLNNFTVIFQLNERIENAVLIFKNPSSSLLKEFNFEGNSITIPIEKLQQILSTFSKNLEKDGKSFSKVQLTDVSIKSKKLYGTLIIEESKKRIITKTIVKGYKDFPKSYFKNYYNINRNTIFNKQKLETIKRLSNNLSFVEEIKPPEILFTKDSTYLYIYLKKRNSSSFNGLINFSSNESGNLIFNGHIDLKLNNIFNTGENLNLFWNSIGEEKQEFELSLNTPYILNSKISPDISFSIYKQDSTFINTKFNTNINYSINEKSKIGLTFSLEDSEKLINDSKNNVYTFNNFFLGTTFQFNIPKNDFFRNDKFSFDINPSIGKRTSLIESSNQFKIHLNTSYIFDINNRNSIFIRNNTGYLNSTNFIENELFRIGGSKSIRGFNEQSIFAKDYTFFNIEYRYVTSEKSYLYSITDIGKINTTIKSEDLLSIGLGYLFTSRNSQINLSVASILNTNTKIDLKSTQLSLNWKNFF
ncbi:hypothetical protein H9I45_07500 [Polaribacter haliotis]|uniref:Haemolysin activator HlyB C-terminal domain-containing protein n=1 Tax=Polaribacter haliotis TaxID=1888915 RepID=A0A7L8AJY4_9FLAO|nr:ShlB/FhaC/HecB family hemolysin secretion/activation protein [Polaribacter haliotis]QOD62277.1 hypothetical protein H9I45_07500 [Polaribacter haliotis]